jgi:hypothetical protein
MHEADTARKERPRCRTTNLKKNAKALASEMEPAGKIGLEMLKGSKPMLRI